MNTLYIIPARGGSKGIPGKNIKLLGDIPLILWTTGIARQMARDEDICVSSDDAEIIAVVENSGLKTPFTRPANLSTDTAGSYEVLLHALGFYEEKGKSYETIVLLQPTSPFRKVEQIKSCLDIFETHKPEMVVAVKEAEANPYYNLFEENSEGYLALSKKGNFARRQDCPPVYQYNGSIYVIDILALKSRAIHQLEKVQKYLMPAIYSVDLDTPFDWMIAETILRENILNVTS